MDQVTHSIEDEMVHTDEDQVQNQITNQDRYNEEFEDDGEVEHPIVPASETEPTRRIASREASTFKQQPINSNFGEQMRRGQDLRVENLNQTSSSPRENENEIEFIEQSAVPEHDSLQLDLNEMRSNQRRLQQNFS